MRNDLKLGAVFVAGIAITIALTAIGGPLTPPTGPVAPTFKTIDETPTSRPVGDLYTPGDADATFVISSSGRYHLASDVLGEAGKAGIRIEAPSVQLDLNGHDVDGRNLGSNGIEGTSAISNVEIVNGVVRRWTGSGINFQSPTFGAPGDVVSLREVTSRENTVDGASITGDYRVESCLFANNGASGFRGATGIVSGSTARGNVQAGITVSGGRVSGCSVLDNSGIGIRAFPSVAVEDNYIAFNQQGGALIGSFCRVEGNHFDFNGSSTDPSFPAGTAIILRGSLTTILNNSASDHQLFVGAQDGFSVSQITMVQNSVIGGILTTLGNVNNIIGPTVGPSDVATSTNPHANYLNN